MNQRRIAVVGAGLAGLTCAQELRRRGFEVVVFEKSRGSGGRMSTRRGVDAAFDHGAQYFTARDPDFVAVVDDWLEDGVVAEWGGRIVRVCDGVVAAADPAPRFVGLPGMSAVARHLAAGLEVHFRFHVASLVREQGGWMVLARDGQRFSGFAGVVLSAPAPQAADLVRPSVPSLAEQVSMVDLAPCWAVMLSFTRRVPLVFDGAFVEGSPLSWIARNSSKPGRSARECWVLHGSPEWSKRHFDTDPQAVMDALLAEFVAVTGARASVPASVAAHRWAYALPLNPRVEGCLIDPVAGLGICGDWCAGARVEGAFVSGRSLASRWQESLG